jgi:hypothetical protein
MRLFKFNLKSALRPFMVAAAMILLSACADRFKASDLTSLNINSTLAKELSNNTSASRAFTDRYYDYVTGTTGSNNNVPPQNTSNVNAHVLLPRHPGAKIYLESQDWYCHDSANMGSNGRLIDNARCGNNLDVGYDSPQSAAAQIDDMVRRGFDGTIVNWYGINSQSNKTMLAMRPYILSAYGGSFKLSADVDKGAFQYGRNGACANTPDNTSLAICFIDYIIDTYGDVLIRTDDGRIAIYWFVTSYDVGAVDWNAVHFHASQRGAALINNDPAGFSAMGGTSDGAYAWVNPTSTDPVSYIDHFFNSALSFPGEVAVGGAWRAFNDVIASWTLDRHIDNQCGMQWLDTFARNDAQPNLTSVMVSTWDDYTEGTEIETGIDNCLNSITGSINGSTLSWSLNFGSSGGVQGSDRSIAYYIVFSSNDGGNTIHSIAAVKPNGMNTGSISVPAVNATGITYFIEAVGQPSIHNFIITAPIGMQN